MNEKIIEKLLEKYVLSDTAEKTSKSTKNIFEWKYVIVRGYDAWVRCGKLIDWTFWNIILEDARNLRRRRCENGIWLSWLASYWLADRDEVKVLETQKRVLITDRRVSTFFEVNSEVEKQLREWKTAEQK